MKKRFLTTLILSLFVSSSLFFAKTPLTSVASTTNETSVINSLMPVYKYDFGGRHNSNSDYISVSACDVNGIVLKRFGNDPKDSFLKGIFTFSTDLPNGEYNVTIIGPKRNLQVYNGDDLLYKGSGSEAKDYLEVSEKVQVTDGQLSLKFKGAVSVIEISKVLKFDLGDTATENSDFISVSGESAYSQDLGYGFNTPENIKNVASSGENELSDAVQFLTYGTTSDNTFNIDIPNGNYKVKVTAGNISRMSVAAEGYYAIMNMTGNNAESEIELLVTDGQLNLLATEGKVGTNFTISSIELTKVADDVEETDTIFVGGDSTVTAYYPLQAEMVPTTQGGWGQMLENYVSDDYKVHNYATGGQYAKGFLTSGQFDAVEHYINEGDYFIVAFGINDSNYSNEEEYKESTIEMVRRIKAKGATPILVTSQGRASDFDENGVHYKNNRWYKNTTIAIAESEGVPFIDLNYLSSAYFTAIGQENTTGLYWIKYDGKQDTLHPNRIGAGQLARLLVEDLANKDIPGFENSKILPYGTSTDLVTKTSTAKINRSFRGTTATVNAQNLYSIDNTVEVTLNVYSRSTGELLDTVVENVTLPAFNPYSPLEESTISISSDVCTFNSYSEVLINDGTSIINCSSDINNVFNNPADIADQLFNY